MAICWRLLFPLCCILIVCGCVYVYVHACSVVPNALLLCTCVCVCACSVVSYSLLLSVCVLSCVWLCYFMDWNPPGSSVQGIFQARIMSRLPFSPAADLLQPGIEPVSSALAGRFFTSEPPGKLEYIVGISEKAMATHSSTLAWKISWMEEPGRLQSMGLLRVGHD